MERVLVTGGAGYIGAILVPLLLKRRYFVTVIDNLLYEHLALMSCFSNKKFQFIKGDVCDHELIKAQIPKHDIIIPLAAIVGEAACKQQPIYARQVNYEANKCLLDNLSDTHKVIYPSSISVYSLCRQERYCTENSLVSPVSLYGQTKSESEDLFLNFKNTIILRIAAVFGISPRMRIELSVNNLTLKAIRDSVVTVSKESAKTNYVHLQDAAEAFLFSIKNFNSMQGEIFNIGLNSANVTKKQICNSIQRFVPEIHVTEILTKDANNIGDYSVSSDKIGNLGWRARVTLEDGIKELICGYRIFNKLYLDN